MAVPKLVLDSAELNITNQDAVGTIKYFIDGVTVGNELERLNAAANLVPYQIGDRYPTSPQGGPFSRYRSINKPGRTTHQLRVVSKRPYLTNNSQKAWVEVGLRSPPALSEDTGSSLIQKRNEFYLTGKNEDPTKTQIVTSFTFPANYWGDGNPKKAYRTPKTSATCTKYFYTETYRVSNTFYFDEISHVQLQNMRQLYVGRVNANVFLYIDSPVGGATGDARQWLCTGINVDSPDNGMSFRITADWTYNIDFWDPLIVQTDSRGNPLRIDPVNLTNVMRSLASSAGGRAGKNGLLPAARIEIGTGICRVPIYQSADHYNLLQILRKEKSPSEL